MKRHHAKHRRGLELLDNGRLRLLQLCLSNSYSLRNVIRGALETEECTTHNPAPVSNMDAMIEKGNVGNRGGLELLDNWQL